MKNPLHIDFETYDRKYFRCLLQSPATSIGLSFPLGKKVWPLNLWPRHWWSSVMDFINGTISGMSFAMWLNRSPDQKVESSCAPKNWSGFMTYWVSTMQVKWWCFSAEPSSQEAYWAFVLFCTPCSARGEALANLLMTTVHLEER